MWDNANTDVQPASPENQADLELVGRIQSGERTAEQALYERYSARVYYLALVRVRAAHDAEDVRSETFLRVLSSIRNRQIHTPRALASFILRTLDNVVLEMRRKQQRADRIADDRGPFWPEYFLDEDLKAAIKQTIALLKPRERDFLRMYYYEELPKDEIAVRTGISRDRVRLLKSRALKSFGERYLRLTQAKNLDTLAGRRSLI